MRVASRDPMNVKDGVKSSAERYRGCAVPCRAMHTAVEPRRQSISAQPVSVSNPLPTLALDRNQRQLHEGMGSRGGQCVHGRCEWGQASSTSNTRGLARWFVCARASDLFGEHTLGTWDRESHCCVGSTCQSQARHCAATCSWHGNHPSWEPRA